MKLKLILEQKKPTRNRLIPTANPLGAFLKANPKYIHDAGLLNVSHQGITSLEGFPDNVNALDICGNELTSLEGFKQSNPHAFNGSFMCSANELTSLEHGPTIVKGSFNCSYNLLTNLKGAPTEVYGVFSCRANRITSLEGMPSIITGDINLVNNRLTSLHNIHRHIKIAKPNSTLYLNENPIRSHVLGVLKIRDLGSVNFGDVINFELTNIINHHLQGDRDVMACQDELIDSGLDEYAQL